MTTIDIFTGASACTGLVAGLLRGPVREIISLIVAAAAAVASIAFYPLVASRLASHFAYADAARFVSFLLCFTIPMVVSGIIMFIIIRLSMRNGLPFGHRLVGGALGLLRGGLIALVVILALLAFPLRTHPLDRSLVLPLGAKAVAAAQGLFPEELAKGVAGELKRIEKNGSLLQEKSGGRKQK